MKTFKTLASVSYITNRNALRLKEDAYSYFGSIGYKLWSVNEIADTDPLYLQFDFRPVSGEGTDKEIEQGVTDKDIADFLTQHDNGVKTADQQAKIDSEAKQLTLKDALANWGAADKDAVLRLLVERAVNG